MQQEPMILTALFSMGQRMAARIASSKSISMIVLGAIGILAGVLVLTPDSGAADDAVSVKPRFEFTCQTREVEFYDWVEASLWNKPQGETKPLRRTLGGAIEALVENPAWVIQLSSISCEKGGMSQRRREALFFMIGDAHEEGAGKIEPAAISKSPRAIFASGR